MARLVRSRKSVLICSILPDTKPIQCWSRKQKPEYGVTRPIKTDDFLRHLPNVPILLLPGEEIHHGSHRLAHNHKAQPKQAITDDLPAWGLASAKPACDPDHGKLQYHA